MGSLTEPKLPVIDFSKETLKPPGTTCWLSVCEDVGRALEDWLFLAVYDGVSSETHNTLFHQVKELFDLPVEIKMRNTSDKPYHGNVRETPFLPLRQALGIDEAMNIENAQSFTNLMWPSGNDRFRESARLLTRRVAELDHMVKRMLFERYGLENTMILSLNQLDTFLNS